MNDITPIFKNDYDDEHDQKLVKQTVHMVTNEFRKIQLTDKLKKDTLIKNDTLNKIKKIRQRIDRDKTKNKIDCPGCHKHDMHIHDDTAKCTGPECNKEFLMVEKHPEDKNKYMCTSCGHTVSKSKAVKLRDEKKNCPLCEKGDTVIDINWKDINKRMK